MMQKDPPLCPREIPYTKGTDVTRIIIVLLIVYFALLVFAFSLLQMNGKKGSDDGLKKEVRMK
jgi:hypothetical protein